MSSLSHLRAALRQVNSGSTHGLTFDIKSLDTEVAKLRGWLGDRGSAKPPQDAIVAALRAFFQNQELQTRRQALLVCFGCVDQVLPAEGRLIEDGERFPKLLEATDAYLPNPRAYRPCYRGLLNAYFVYDAEKAQSDGRQNWERLRTYLRDRAANTVAPGLLPAWVDALQANAQLLGNDPGESYGRALLNGQSEAFESARKALDIHDNSWLIWRLVLGQVDAASREDDNSFQRYLPNLLDLLARHPLAINGGLPRILARYRDCNTATVHPGLRDFAVAKWGNPWLTLNRAKWSLVKDEARAMVAGWLKLVLIQQFFSLLAADGTNDTRRLKFWEKYHDSIDDMYFALGSSARWHRGADFQDIRKKMEGRLLNLHSAGAPDNNAFIMCIRDFVVVEFGLSGNACYIFRRDNLPFALDGDIAGNSTALKHPACVERILHIDKNSGKWERQFQQTLASLMRVQPTQQSIPGAVQSRVQPNIAAGAATARPAPTPQTYGSAFAEREFYRFCYDRQLTVKDLRKDNGNLWVLTGDSNGNVSNQLRSWGFVFKSGKGWWQK